MGACLYCLQNNVDIFISEYRILVVGVPPVRMFLVGE
jgi:hypothetical protein